MFLQGVLQDLGDKFEMLAGFVGDAALGVASVIAGEAIATAAAGKRMEKILRVRSTRRDADRTGAPAGDPPVRPPG